ncbi:F-actin-capping protein subunit alpha [Thoreauomyces humboldtii]|nr:F-actin-capping protein subunit alpha [Thoreauomyces humboldtii]
MSEANLASLIKRLEAATQRIEEVATRQKGPAESAATASANTGAASGAASGASGPAISAFEDLVSTYFQPFLAASAGVGGLVQEQVKYVQDAVAAQKALIQVAATSKKPDNATLIELVKPMQTAMMKASELREKSRSDALYHHLSTISEGIPALQWVVVEPTPAPYVGDMRDSSQFWANRVIKDQKDKDKSHVDWANSYIAFLTELQSYVKKHHTTGLSWNPRGGDAKAAAAASPSAAPATSAAPPPPPPTPAVGVEPSSTRPAGGPPAGALFSALNKEGLTSGLRKVDKSEMTHKNPELRVASVVKADAIASSAGTGVAKSAAPVRKAPPRLELDGSKWAIENHMNNNSLVIKPTEFRQVAYIYNCQNSTIQINGKINTVTMDNCKKVGLLVENAVSTIDVVNCKSVQVQITGRAPTVVIDKTDGMQLYLSKECNDIEILTAKSSEMNVLIQGEDDEYTEKPIAEQFKTSLVNGVLVTVPVEHSG